MQRSKFIVVLPLTSLLFTGCATDEFGNKRPLNRAETGALIGAVAGAAVGAATSKNKTKGVLIGAVGGGLAGGAVGAYMDKQKRDLEKVLAKERESGAIDIEKQAGDVLKVTMTSQTAFEVDSADIKGGFHSTLDKIADVLKRYGKTRLNIVGHTDNSGSDSHNMALSQRRSAAVQSYLLERGVIPERLTATGMGESSPRAANSTEEGRRLNRRVEIYIEPIIEEKAG